MAVFLLLFVSVDFVSGTVRAEMKPTLEVNLAHRSYPIFIRSGVLEDVSLWLPRGQRCALITDETVHELYGRELSTRMERFGCDLITMHP